MRWLVLLAALGCEGVLPAPDLERMIDQPSVRPYEGSSRFADGRGMRTPPAGTVAHDRPLGQPALLDGVVDGHYTAVIPVPLDRALLARGRDRFDIFCAPCHGLRGDGISEVARNMALRPPPSLIEAPVTGFPPGRVFQVIGTGYALMPAYGGQLPPHDRWSVVAYLRALQLSQGVRLAALPPPVRAEASAALGQP